MEFAARRSPAAGGEGRLRGTPGGDTGARRGDAGGWARVKSGCMFPILAMNGDLLETANWPWGLSLIALTIAMHATGVVVLAFVSLRIRVRIANRRLGLRYVIPMGMRLRRDSWDMTAVTQQCTACPSLAAAAL